MVSSKSLGGRPPFLYFSLTYWSKPRVRNVPLVLMTSDICSNFFGGIHLSKGNLFSGSWAVGAFSTSWYRPGCEKSPTVNEIVNKNSIRYVHHLKVDESSYLRTRDIPYNAAKSLYAPFDFAVGERHSCCCKLFTHLMRKIFYSDCLCKKGRAFFVSMRHSSLFSCRTSDGMTITVDRSMLPGRDAYVST